MPTLNVQNVSVVIAAQEHNPTILHPSFLVSQAIVPNDWEVTQGPVCTPAFSAVSFKNGITMVAESSRVQIIDNAPTDPKLSQAGEIAERYITTLPHVHYTAIGINFAVAIETPDPEKILIESFLKPHSWRWGSEEPAAFGMRAVFQLTNSVLTVSCDPGLSARGNSAILVAGNFNTDVKDAQPLPTIQDVLRTYPQTCDKFFDLVRSVFKELPNAARVQQSV